MTTGKVEAIWSKRMKGGPMDSQDHVVLKAGRGIVDNADQGGKRQVTLIEKEAWEALMAEVGASLDPSRRRANLMVSGIRLADSRHRILRIGECRIRIYGETKPCEQMDKAWPGLREAMYDNWSGGAFGEILDDGKITLGDSIQWLE